MPYRLEITLLRNYYMCAERLSPTKEKTKLHLGCGKQKWPGYLNIDCIALPSVDVVVNLDNYPWPFESDAWENVVAHHLFEHLNDTVCAVRELHRILTPGGKAEVWVPHVAGWEAWSDPTHHHFFTRWSFEYFRRGHPCNYYFDFAFTDVRARNILRPDSRSFVVGLLNRLLNTNLYDRLLWKYLPCAEIRVIFEK
jgi:SAM-dependent methyltransferase